MAAIGLARKFRAQVDPQAEQTLIDIVREGEIKEPEVDWQPLFHPDPVQTKGYELLAYQLLGLAWAGEPATQLQPLARTLMAQQRPDGGWAQLPALSSDAYATGQAVYALRVAPGMRATDPAIPHGLRFLLANQLEDGTWHVRRRAFPFQPTMDSGFPHGRDGWISAAGTSWAVMALSLPEEQDFMTEAHDVSSGRHGG